MIELLEELSNRGERIALYVAGALQDLSDEGLISYEGGQQLALSARGLARYDQLRASGFRPTRGEIDACLAALARIGRHSFQDGVADLIENLDGVKDMILP